MSFLRPGMLLVLLLGLPALVAGYAALVRRRARGAPALGTMVEDVPPRRRAWGRYLPAAVFFAAIAVLLVGLARPETIVAWPRREGTVVLAFDVSSSMRAEDLEPSRITAAKRAARAFVSDQPSGIRIGVVAFNDNAFVVQAPTRSRRDVLAAVRRLRPEGGTSLGDGILGSIGAVVGRPVVIDQDALASGGSQPEVPFVGSAVVVLLSDGENTAGSDPVAFAHVASQAGVRLYPVGVGSPEGSVVEIDGFQVATALDEDLLREIAASSNGRYFRARDAAELRRIYSSVDLQLTVRGRRTEATAVVAGIGLVLLVVASLLASRRFARVP